MSDRKITDLDSRLQPIAQAGIGAYAMQANDGSTVRLIETWRDATDQNACESDGRSKAKFGHSPHNYVDASGKPAARAFDFGVFTVNGAYVDDGTDRRYAIAAEIWAGIGDETNLPLTLGMNWTMETDGCKPDYDHVEIRGYSMLPPLV